MKDTSSRIPFAFLQHIILQMMCSKFDEVKNKEYVAGLGTIIHFIMHGELRV